MPSKVKLLRINTPGASPTTAQIDLGELCVHVADGKIFFKKLNGEIEDILVLEPHSQVSIGSLGDVDITTVTPAAGQVLVYNSTTEQFEPGDVSTNLSYTSSTRVLGSSTGTNVTLPEVVASGDSGLITGADKSKLDGISAGAEVNVATDLSYTASTRELASSTGTNVTLPEVSAGGDSGLMTGADKTKLDGLQSGQGSTNLSYTASTRVIASSSGTDATLPEVSAGGDSGLMTGADKTKLDGIDAGAEVNTVTSVNSATGAVVLDADDIDDTSTTNKFVTSADITALSTLESDLSGKADLSGGKLDTSQLPDIAITEFKGSVASQTAMLAVSGEKGDWVVRSDDGKVYVITGTDPSVIGSWTALSYPVSSGTDLSYTGSTRVLASSTGTNVTLPNVVAGGNSGLMTGADKTKLNGIESGAEVNVGTNLSYTGSTRVLASSTGTNATLPNVVAGGNSGLMTGADKTKLNGIETGATADQTKADIDALNINADQVDGLHASQFLRSDANDSTTGTITAPKIDTPEIENAGSILLDANGAASDITLSAADHVILQAGEEEDGAIYFRGNSAADTYRFAKSGQTAIEGFLSFESLTADRTYTFPNSGGTIALTTSSVANADTVDNLHASSFIRADANDTATGTITFNGVVNIRSALDLADNDILRFGSGDDCEMFVNGSHMYMDLNGGIGNFYIRDGTTTRFTFNDNGGFTATGTISGTFNTTNVRTAIASHTAGQKGTYAFCSLRNNSADRSANYTTSGSNLRYSNANGNDAGTPGGSWRLMGRLAGNADTSHPQETSLWVRYA